MIARSLLLLAFSARVLSAQANPQTTNARLLWDDVTKYVEQSAVDVPEEKYGYKPTNDVRTFGQLIAHVAGVQGMLCALALGDSPRAPDAVEKSAKTKEALIAALRASNEYCARAYAQSDAATAGKIDFFGDKRTRLYALLFNATHDNEHYGNIVTYLRLNGIVPPSSRPAVAK